MRKCLATSLLFVLWNLAVTTPVYPEEFSGQVIDVVDGDTIEVMHLGKPERVRLHGVDCPELGQPYGKRAKQYTTTHTLRKMITVIVDETDEQGRTVGQVILPDMSNLNLVILSAGLGWWHGADDPEDQILKDVQRSARSAGRGLWSDPAPVPPWEWRGRPAKPVPSQPVQPATTGAQTPALDEAGQ